MSAQPASKNGYQQHRDRQRAAILEAAHELFLQKGIAGTTMGEIAESARITRATIYQYFANQTDIAWTLLEAYFQEFQKDISNSPLFRTDLSGYQQLKGFLSSSQDAFARHLEAFRFLAQFDVMYASSQDVERLLALGERIFGSGGNVEPVIEAVRKGQADGSLRRDLDPVLAAAALTNMVLSMAVRMVAHRQSITVEYRHPPEQILTEACRLLLEGMRAPQFPS